MAEKVNILAVYNICRELVAQAEKSAEQNNGKVDESILPPLKEAFEKVIEFEKIHLITAHDVFYGSILINMDTKISFNIRGPMDLDLKKEPIVLLFNPLYLAKYKYAEFTALVVSEILRLVYAHPASFATLNSGKDTKAHNHLEKASSASISSMVQQDIRLSKTDQNKKLILPQDAYTAAKVNQETGKTPKDNSSLEYYYKFLQNFAKGDGDLQSQQEQPNPNGQSGQGMGQGQPNPNGQSGQGMGQGQPNPNGQPDPNAAATQNNQNGQTPHQWEGLDSEDAKEKIKSMVSEAYDNMNEKQRGFMPAGLVEQIQKLLKKPEISWKQVLRKYVGAIPVPHRKTKTRLNRRQPYRADLSGQLPKRHVELVIAIDTSGSMSNSDIAYVINEIFNIVKDYDSKITIIECDAQIGRIYQPKKACDVSTRVTGRGGTSFHPVINHINETGAYKNALMIYFTDGYGDYEIPKPRTMRNLWVVLQDEKNLSLKEPYGEVKALKKDADWIKMNDGN